MAPADVRVNEIIAALADLSPQPSLERGGKRQIPLEWFQWLPNADWFIRQTLRLPPDHDYSSPLTIQRAAVLVSGYDAGLGEIPVDRQLADRLAAIDQIRAQSGSIRVGWGFVAGTTQGLDGKPTRVFEPLVSVRARVRRSIVSAGLVPSGDLELNPAIVDSDGEIARQLEYALLYAAELPDAPADATRMLKRMISLQKGLRVAADAAGIPVGVVEASYETPSVEMRRDGLAALAVGAIFVDTPTQKATRATTLRSWTARNGVDRTALRHLYLGAPASDAASGPQPAPHGGQGGSRALESPFLLTPRQREAVVSSLERPLTLVSGSPGTGKSHTVAAMAVDAVSRGRSVLIATRTDATVDSLVDLLDRMPGPGPVVFGSNERRDAVVERLTSGKLHAAADVDLIEARRRFDLACAERSQVRSRIGAHLELEQLAEGRPGSVGLQLIDRVASIESETVLALLADAQESGGWLGRRRGRKAWDELVQLLGITDDETLSPARIRAALVTAEARRADLLRGPDLAEEGSDWDRLLAADDAVRTAVGELIELESRSPERLDRAALVSIANLATALRSGRSARREQLARLTKTEITQALPLWIGTLADIDDLLPPNPALFDLVILDEASSIDQPLAAPALLRASRAVVVGDPKQLRHVSFLSDDRIRAVLDDHDISADPQLAALLDVRRNSLFDVAAGAVPVIELDEQFRSDPHLIDFVSRRLYGGAMEVATRNPRTESVDCVELVPVDGHRDESGVVVAEVREVIVRLRGLLRDGARSVGVVTPFRAQADAIESAVLKAFSADDVEALDLRIGTVHAMQGNERDVVIASMGIGPDDTASWRFVEDPHLFAVLVTRARRRFQILLSAQPPASGLVADYLAQADDPPRPTRSARDLDPWVESIARGVELAGVRVTAPYPAGRHRLDLCVGDDIDFVGVEAQVHPHGVDAHIDRHLALRRAGWRLVEAFEGRWDGQAGELAIELSNAVKARHRPKSDAG